MVSIVFPDFGPNFGKISWITGSWEEKANSQLETSCLGVFDPGITSDSLDLTGQIHLIEMDGRKVKVSRLGAS